MMNQDQAALCSVTRQHIVNLVETGNVKAAICLFAMYALLQENTDWFDNAGIHNEDMTCTKCGNVGRDSPVGFWPGLCPDCFGKMLDSMPLPHPNEIESMLSP